jgi:hypothetical protein
MVRAVLKLLQATYQIESERNNRCTSGYDRL